MNHPSLTLKNGRPVCGPGFSKGWPREKKEEMSETHL
jgi:hypothetical protein